MFEHRGWIYKCIRLWKSRLPGLVHWYQHGTPAVIGQSPIYRQYKRNQGPYIRADCKRNEFKLIGVTYLHPKLPTFPLWSTGDPFSMRYLTTSFRPFAEAHIIAIVPSWIHLWFDLISMIFLQDTYALRFSKYLHSLHGRLVAAQLPIFQSQRPKTERFREPDRKMKRKFCRMMEEMRDMITWRTWLTALTFAPFANRSSISPIRLFRAAKNKPVTPHYMKQCA